MPRRKIIPVRGVKLHDGWYKCRWYHTSQEATYWHDIDRSPDASHFRTYPCSNVAELMRWSVGATVPLSTFPAKSLSPRRRGRESNYPLDTLCHRQLRTGDSTDKTSANEDGSANGSPLPRERWVVLAPAHQSTTFPAKALGDSHISKAAYRHDIDRSPDASHFRTYPCSNVAELMRWPVSATVPLSTFPAKSLSPRRRGRESNYPLDTHCPRLL